MWQTKMSHYLLKFYKSNQRPHKHHKAKRNMLVVAIRLISPQLQIMNFDIKKQNSCLDVLES